MNLNSLYIESLRIVNYRTLKDVTLRDIRPFSVLLGKNGSGKTSILDAISFLSDSLSVGLRETLRKKGGIKEIITKDQSTYFTIFTQLYDDVTFQTIQYFITVGMKDNHPVLLEEDLFDATNQVRLLHFENGEGFVNDGAYEVSESLASSDVFGISVFGKLSRYPLANFVLEFFSNLEIYDFQVEYIRNTPIFEHETTLSKRGENLANVLYYNQTEHPQIYHTIITKLKEHIPSLERIEVRLDPLQNVNQIYMIDKGFSEPINKNTISNGTLKMLAYYLLLLHPQKLAFMGIEEPENYIYPSFIIELAESCRESSEYGQVLVSTHSPFFVNSLHPDEVWLCKRDVKGFTTCENVAHNETILLYVNNGAQLGHLWSEGYL